MLLSVNRLTVYVACGFKVLMLEYMLKGAFLYLVLLFPISWSYAFVRI